MNYCTKAAAKLLLMLLLVATCLATQAQQLKKIEYFFDKDPGLGKGVQFTTPKTVNVDSTLTFNVSSLTNGLHVVYVRAQDTTGNWGLGYSASFIKTTGGSPGDTVNYLTKVEYFFDKDPGVGKAKPLTIKGSPVSIDSILNFSLSSLTNGLHTLYVRAQDINENWGLAYSASFVRQPGNDSVFVVNKMEYFLDTDPGFGNGTPLTITPGANIDQTFNFTIPVNGDTARTLYVRAQDSRGNWSLLYDTTLNPTTLPLLVLGFTGQTVKGTNELNATFADAVNVKVVELQRSADGFSFTTLGNMATAPAIDGKHVYIDQLPYNGNNYYRLKMIDNDGNTSFSNIVLLYNGGMLHVNVYPNPFHDNISVEFANAKAGNYTATIIDLAGRRLQTLPFALNQGSQSVTLQAGNYASGTYFIEMRDASGNVILNQKIIKR